MWGWDGGGRGRVFSPGALRPRPDKGRQEACAGARRVGGRREARRTWLRVARPHPSPSPGAGGGRKRTLHTVRALRDSAPSGFFLLLASGKRETSLVPGAARVHRPVLAGTRVRGTCATRLWVYSLGGPHAHSACGPLAFIEVRVIAPPVPTGGRARVTVDRELDRDGVGPRGAEAVGSSLPATYYAVSSTWLVRCAARAAGAPCAQGGHGNYAH